MKNNVYIDSDMDEQGVFMQNPDSLVPKEITDQMCVFPVEYYSFDGNIHQGQIVVDKRLALDVKKVFATLLHNKFPVNAAIPSSDSRYHWDDDLLMEQNITSAFNYRTIAGTSKLSLHAKGQAIDINPLQNPYINTQGKVSPPQAVYDAHIPGTITEDSFVVGLFESLGWEWGGRWNDRKDYQHFQKRID